MPAIFRIYGNESQPGLLVEKPAKLLVVVTFLTWDEAFFKEWARGGGGGVKTKVSGR